MLERHAGVTALAWRPGSSAVLASGGSDGVVALWQVSRGLPSRAQRPVAEWDVAAPVADLAWVDSDRLAVADRSGTVRCLAVPAP